MTSFAQPPAESPLPPYRGGALDIECMFEPLPLGPVTLANRFIMPGMQRGWCVGGAPEPRLAEYYRQRAEADVAMIISESCAIDHPSATAQRTAARLTAQTAGAWMRCVDAVRGAGSEFLIQLWHEGALRKDSDGRTRSPSGLAYRDFRQGKSLTQPELEELREAYVSTALRARDIGATGIELHCGHGYLLDLFLWETTNSRSDLYGGPDVANRVRFPAEIVSAIRQACGPNFLISVRFSQWKQYDYEARIASAPSELAILTAALKAAGSDMLHPSARRFWIPEWDGSDLSLAGWVRKLSELPTVAVGSIGLSKDVMEALADDGPIEATISQSLAELVRRFERNEFDLIAVGRSLIGDAEWVQKVRAGDITSLRPFQREDLASLEWDP